MGYSGSGRQDHAVTREDPWPSDRGAVQHGAQTSGSVGAARTKLESLERRAAAQITRAQSTLKDSLDSITRTLATSKNTVESKAGRLTRAVRAGVRAGTRAYRRRARR